jgi:hypothetical protein
VTWRSYEFFLPTYKALRRWKNGCGRNRICHCFPGYLFIPIAVLSVNVIARSIAVDLCDLEPVLVRRSVAGSPDNEKAVPGSEFLEEHRGIQTLSGN